MFLVLLLTSAFLSAGVLLGDQNVESTLDSNADGRAQAFQTTASASGVLSSLSLYVDPTSTASQIEIGLYSDAGGHPSSLLTQAVFTPQAGVWNTVSVPPAAVVSGTRYWIAVLGLGRGRPYFRDTMRGCTSEGSSSGELAALPAAWSTGGIWSACALSAYGSTSGSGGVTVSVTVAPASASLLAGGTQQFTATVTGTSNTAVTWSATGGSISWGGMYTAPTTAGTYTVKATSAADTTKSASATVTVSAPVVAVSISPAAASIRTGGTQQFAATVTGTSNTAVTWSASGGSISSGGMYTAPTTAGTYTVKATSAADNTKSASATVTVAATTTHSATLSWTASTSSVVGYNVYRATQSGGPYTMINTALQAGTSYADLSVQAGSTYYYVVTAVSSSGTESVNSSQVTAVVP
ncbi:MAG: choice-of-anchor R domain-containing protein [Terriglobales bacterium]